MTAGKTTALNALILDAGNTRIRVAGWRGADQDPREVGTGTGPVLPAAAFLPEIAVVPTPAPAMENKFLATMAAIRTPHAALPVILTSVVPRVVVLLKSLWPDLIVVDHTCPLPFQLAQTDPASIGADRLCNIAAAAASGCQRALIVDAGTATTFDLLLDGVFAGGLIAPGMAFAAQCLGESAARLTPVPFADCALEPGRDTDSAMQAGAYHVGVGGVEAVIAALAQKYGPLPVVVTGGLGGTLDRDDRLWDPDWTLRGAAILAMPTSIA